MHKWKVGVIGAGGRVGLPFALVNADCKNYVFAIDRDVDRICELNKGKFPFKEDGGQELLNKILRSGNISFTITYDCLSDCNVIVTIVGTPVDAEGNPRLDDLLNCVETQIIPNLKKGTLVILRSTVAPGTTELVRNKINKETGWQEGFDYTLVYAPERVSEGHSLKETKSLPQLIGAFSHQSYSHAANYFWSFCDQPSQKLSTREAELAKLMTNMYRYVNFALSNEFYMIADSQGCDAHKIIKAANYRYPRMDCPYPGFAAGPCLFKDGKFLVSDVPYTDLIRASFEINEGFPEYVWGKLKNEKHVKSCVVWGMAFKPDSDDIRHSLSFKMVKILKRNGVNVIRFDPLIYKHDKDDLERIANADAHILMTPHKVFQSYGALKKEIANNGGIVIDVWDKWIEKEKGEFEW